MSAEGGSEAERHKASVCRFYIIHRMLAREYILDVVLVTKDGLLIARTAYRKINRYKNTVNLLWDEDHPGLVDGRNQGTTVHAERYSHAYQCPSKRTAAVVRVGTLSLPPYSREIEIRQGSSTRLIRVLACH
jgi:hypothetical protein